MKYARHAFLTALTALLLSGCLSQKDSAVLPNASVLVAFRKACVALEVPQNELRCDWSILWDGSLWTVGWGSVSVRSLEDGSTFECPNIVGPSSYAKLDAAYRIVDPRSFSPASDRLGIKDKVRDVVAASLVTLGEHDAPISARRSHSIAKTSYGWTFTRSIYTMEGDDLTTIRILAVETAYLDSLGSVKKVHRVPADELKKRGAMIRKRASVWSKNSAGRQNSNFEAQ